MIEQTVAAAVDVVDHALVELAAARLPACSTRLSADHRRAHRSRQLRRPRRHAGARRDPGGRCRRVRGSALR
jgi:hypothetical protein